MAWVSFTENQSVVVTAGRFFISDCHSIEKQSCCVLQNSALNTCGRVEGCVLLCCVVAKLTLSPPFLSHSLSQDYKLGIGITSIDMNVGNVKDMDRRAFDLTTPYRIFRSAIRSFFKLSSVRPMTSRVC